MRVADSSLLYAAIDGRDARHSDAQKKLSDPESILVPLTVLAEFLDLLEYRHGRAVAAQAERALRAWPHLVVRHAGDPEASLLRWRHNAALSLVDCIGIQACLETGADLLSYDADQVLAMPTR